MVQKESDALPAAELIADPFLRRSPARGAVARYGEVMSSRLSPYEVDVLPFVRPFTDALVASLRSTDLARIDRVLDHGSGTGEVILQLREAGLRASVVALEPNAIMMERLRHNVQGHPTTETFEGVLADYVAQHRGEQFGLTTSQLVLSFVDDPLAEL